MKMAYTGYKIIQYIDDNPKSSGYGQTWTERVLDTSNCPSGDSSWNLISSSCEATTSGYTGRRINIYYNNVTGEYSSTTETDSGCTASSSEENWVNSGDTYCEQDENGIYTGWGIQLQVQRNSNLINFGEVREVRFSSTTCSDETNPDWETISTNCKVVADMLTCRLYFDGTADILQIDINPSSPTFNQTRTITGFSEDCVCEACDSVEESWSYIADYCGNQMPSEYQLSGLTDDTVYHVYRMYETCIIDGQSGRTRPTNVYSAETYQTGVSGCMYRWVDTEETVCNEKFDGKFKATYSGGTTYSAECDSSTELTTATTKPSGYQYSAMTEAVIGDCVTNIGNGAFQNCTGLTSCTIGSGVTSIGQNAFNGCRSLTSIVIPSGVTSIGDSSFYSCYSLSSITIPDSVTSIGRNAFSYTPWWTSYSADTSHHYGNVIYINDVAYKATATTITSAELKDSTVSIGGGTFQNCSGLTNITIPDSVISIGTYAFMDCSGLTSVTVESTTPPALGSTVFYNTNNCPIYVPSGSVNDYKNASGWSSYSSRITAIPNS